ncbi:MAG: hypothetical protein EPO09_03445 [Aquabacterium sp.]|uniref:hypothetical protein n=1 Tax=Aquabacterium sp. TaxID=1872578 RepID=UPI0011F958FD|nr:hypothetical protein [Aquabacterium sp.]TAK97710.1 MAG: hypothetical protein EPO09_03445 [Aquabacterium sp.]
MKLVRKPWQAVVLSLVGASLVTLSGCGGGGGAPADTSATVSSTEGSTTASRFTAMEVPMLMPAVSTSPSSASTAAAVATPTTTTGKTLLIMDTTTGQVVRQYSVSDWSVVDRFSLDAGTGEPHHKGTGHVYMIQDGKVMQLDLSGATLGEPKQISSITTACTFSSGRHVSPYAYLALDGQHVWLQVLTVGAGASCDSYTTNYKTYLVSSDMPTTEVGRVQWGKFTNGVTFVGTLAGSQQGAGVQGVMLYDRVNLRLAVYSADLKQEQYVVRQDSAPLVYPPVFRGLLPGTQKGLLQLDGIVYVMDWSSGKLVLTDSGIKIAQISSTWLQATDRKNAKTYLSDGITIYAIDGATGAVSTFGTIDAAKGSVRGMYVAGNALVINQGHYADPTRTPPQVYDSHLVIKDLGTRQETEPFGVLTENTTVYGASGNALMLSISPTTAGSTDLVRMDVSTGERKTVFSGVFMSAYISYLGVPVKWGGIEYTDFMLSTAVVGGGMNISSYSVTTGKTLPMGTLPKPSTTSGWSWGLTTYWASAPVAMTWADQLWTYDPQQANSLTQAWPTPALN